MVLKVLCYAVLMCSLACGVLCVGLLVGVWGVPAALYVMWECMWCGSDVGVYVDVGTVSEWFP